MKNVTRFLLLFLVIGVLSCRDTKKEEAAFEAEVKEIEAIEKEVDSISDSIEKDAKELEDALNELDNI